MTPTPAVPLARLLAMSFRFLIDGLHDRLRAEGWTDVRPAFGFVLLAARDAAMTNTQVATLMGTSKQAASKLLDVMVAARYVERVVDINDGRSKTIVIAARGSALLVAVERIYAGLEREWADVIGRDNLENTRRNLTDVLTNIDGGTLPSVRPTS